MKTVALLLLLGFLTNEAHAAAAPPSKDLTAVTENSEKFALDLYMKLKNDKSNLVVSPIGVQIVSAMLSGGARGKTLVELKKVMRFPDDKEVIRNGYKELLQQLQTPQLKMANNVFPEKELKLNPEFLKEMVDYYSSKIDPLPFSTDPTFSAKRINDWADEKTNGKIKEIVSSDELSDTIVLLANAIYFKAKWKYTFQEKFTRDQKFHTSKNSHATVKMMKTKETFGYAHVPEIGAKVLEMPYEEEKFRMVVFLPDEIEGLSLVEKKLHQLGIAKVLKQLRKEQVEVEIPRFKIESSLDLIDPLKELGVNDLFERACNLSGMVDPHLPVRVGKVKQKAFIEVNEEGTEAAAVTVAQIMTYSLLGTIDKKEFIVDRPVIALIVQRPNTVLFIARLVTP